MYDNLFPFAKSGKSLKNINAVNAVKIDKINKCPNDGAKLFSEKRYGENKPVKNNTLGLLVNKNNTYNNEKELDKITGDKMFLILQAKRSANATISNIRNRNVSSHNDNGIDIK